MVIIIYTCTLDQILMYVQLYTTQKRVPPKENIPTIIIN